MDKIFCSIMLSTVSLCAAAEIADTEWKAGAVGTLASVSRAPLETLHLHPSYDIKLGENRAAYRREDIDARIKKPLCGKDAYNVEYYLTKTSGDAAAFVAANIVGAAIGTALGTGLFAAVTIPTGGLGVVVGFPLKVACSAVGSIVGGVAGDVIGKPIGESVGSVVGDVALWSHEKGFYSPSIGKQEGRLMSKKFSKAITQPVRHVNKRLGDVSATIVDTAMKPILKTHGKVAGHVTYQLVKASLKSAQKNEQKRYEEENVMYNRFLHDNAKRLEKGKEPRSFT